MKRSNFAKPLIAGGCAAAVLIMGTAFAGPAVAAETDVSPKNVIVMIGDGMGYNHIDFMNAETTGEVHWQVKRGGDHKVINSGQNTKPTEGWQSWNHLGMSTNWVDGPAYDTNQSWTDWEWNKNSPTDSAAAGTAMATGVKTYNAGIGVDPDGKVVENLSERAQSLGKSAGVVSSVPYSHATPAAYSSHHESRKATQEIAKQQIDGPLEVVIGAAHPFYDDNHQPRATGDFSYIAQEDWNRVSTGQTDRAFLETKEDFEALTTGDTPSKVFGTPQVSTTLQQARSAGAPVNDVPDLPILTEGALNVLDNNDKGFMLMVEGGAIDWTGHANQSDRNLEEVKDFDRAIDSVVDWVETNSSWDETLVVVTADHETGYLYGETPGDYSSIIPSGADDPAGTLPKHSWNSGDHTNQLVGYFYKGAGADQVTALGTGRDLIRGRYLDNTSMAKWLLDTAWVEPEAPAPSIRFIDVPKTHKFYTQIQWMAQNKITTGTKTPKGLAYEPKKATSREAMAAFLFRMYADGDYRAPKKSPFVDVPTNHKFYTQIAWMADQGISTGTKTSKGRVYEPKQATSREAMAAFLYRAENVKGFKAPAKSPFIDVKKGDKFYTQIAWMADQGISTGTKTPKGKVYEPKTSTSREAMSAFLYRIAN